MKKSRKWLIGLGLPLAVLAGLQFLPAARTNPPPGTEIDVPEPVAAILKRSCYDCHSNGTRWPWYSGVAPVSWWLSDDVNEGREHLNFTEWTRDANTAALDLAKVYDQVSEGEMPPVSYLLLHPGARLSDAEREKILDWASDASQIK